MVHGIFPTEPQLNKGNASGTETAFLNLNLSMYNDTVSSNIYDKQEDFDSVYFPFLDGDVPQRPSYGAYIPQLRKQDFRHHKLRKALSKFDRRHNELIKNIMSVFKKKNLRDFGAIHIMFIVHVVRVGVSCRISYAAVS